MNQNALTKEKSVISFTQTSEIRHLGGNRRLIFFFSLWALCYGGAENVHASRAVFSKSSITPLRVKHGSHELSWDIRISLDHRIRAFSKLQSPEAKQNRTLFKGRLVLVENTDDKKNAHEKTSSEAEAIPGRLKQKRRGRWKLMGEKEFKTAKIRLVISGEPGSSVIRLVTQIKYLKSTFVQHERIEMHFPCSEMTYLDRSESLTSLSATTKSTKHHIDRWTHKLVNIRDGKKLWALVSAPDLSGITLEAERNKTESSATGNKTKQTKENRTNCKIVLEHDDVRNHPVLYATRCKRRWYPPSKRRLRSRRFRRKGEKITRQAFFHLGKIRETHKSRLPNGFAAAVSFADHADQSAPGPLRALLLGRSDATFSKPAGGFIGNGLHFTKTLFNENSPKPQMQHPRVRAIVKKGKAKGIEFGPHSATPDRDNRKTTERALKTFAKWGSTWIDHQPDTNCEAYSCRGWDPSSRFFIADLLAKHGFVYVWSGNDIKLSRGKLNMLKPHKRQTRASFFFPFHVSTKHRGILWLFRSAWFYLSPKDFSQRLSSSNLNRLAEKRGIFIAHTYLDAHHGPRHRRHRLALIRRHKRGHWYLHPSAEDALKRLSGAQQKNKIWVPSMKELGDHLSCWNNITLYPLNKNTLFLQNPEECPVPGFTFRIKGKWKVTARLTATNFNQKQLARDKPGHQKSVSARSPLKEQKIRTYYQKPWTVTVLHLPGNSSIEVSTHSDS